MKRNAILVELEQLVDTSSHGEGEIVCAFKIGNDWISMDSNGKRWRNLDRNLRNRKYYRPIKEMSIDDIIYELCKRDEDYFTVARGFIEEAIDTTFKESESIHIIEDVFEYIMKNLI